MLTHSSHDFKKEMSVYVWDFVLSDNILYNYEMAEVLFSVKSNLLSKKELINKPILILLVSVIEGILIDFIIRLADSTTHFPKSISDENKTLIKVKLNSERKRVRIEDPIVGTYEFSKVKNYHLNEIVDLLKEYELFGNKDDLIYKKLNNLNKLRNRIHSRNFFGNFQRYEKFAFTEERLINTVFLLRDINLILKTKYPRPW